MMSRSWSCVVDVVIKVKEGPATIYTYHGEALRIFYNYDMVQHGFHPKMESSASFEKMGERSCCPEYRSDHIRPKFILNNIAAYKNN